MDTKKRILERFLTYVKVDTQSETGREQIPSTSKQFVLAKMLKQELEAIGMQDVHLDEHCYLMATLPANTDKPLPVIGFVSHIDTAPDFTGLNVSPLIWENYQGGDLTLDAENGVILSPSEFSEMRQYIGQTLITTNGKTLLGADDKAGVTEIVSAMEYLIQHPEIERGKIRICFTPDEEVGRGADLFDVNAFGADWAYTMDGSLVGELEYENFNAASASVQIQGKNIHPGYAKGKMVNAIHIATEFSQAFPAQEVPEHTEGYEGFYHLHTFDGTVDACRLDYIIRDHDRSKFETRKQFFLDLVAQFNQKYDNRLRVELKDSYYNMREKVEPHMHIIDLAEKAMLELGIRPLIHPIRGGTDGSRLSYMGLPCPNIFAGGLNFHGRYEYVPLESIVAATQVIVKIVELHAKG